MMRAREATEMGISGKPPEPAAANNLPRMKNAAKMMFYHLRGISSKSVKLSFWCSSFSSSIFSCLCRSNFTERFAEDLTFLGFNISSTHNE